MNQDFLVNQQWCTNCRIISRSCTPELETLTIICRPFYLPREIPSVILTAAYIPPEVCAKSAMSQLADIITTTEDANPGAKLIISGDFNHTNLRKQLPKYYQHVTCSTRGNNILDHCYSTIRGAYRSLKRAPLGESDHNMVHLVPVYKQQLKRQKPVKRSVRSWSATAIESLRGCFACTEWEVFMDSSSDLDECTDVIMDYVKFCEDICVPTRVATFYPNQKPWFNKSIRNKHLAKEEALRSNDPSIIKAAKKDLKKSIALAKKDYKQHLQEHVETSNSRELWQGINKITNYKSKSACPLPDDPDLPDQLNVFFSRFEKQMPASFVDNDLPQSVVISERDTARVLSKLNVHKAPGPDGITARLLRTCADELCGVLTDLFNWSLRICIFPSIFKRSVIIPVPKKSSVTSLNDYRPVALTSQVAKSFERLILRALLSFIPSDLDPFQFAYRTNRSVDDAVSLTLDNILAHLDLKGSTYARILYIDFSSAFNTILPSKLYTKLQAIGVDISLCNWIFDFLSNRPQVVRVGSRVSKSITLSTGAP